MRDRIYATVHLASTSLCVGCHPKMYHLLRPLPKVLSDSHVRPAPRSGHNIDGTGWKPIGVKITSLSEFVSPRGAQ